jgi:hypothetical protein
MEAKLKVLELEKARFNEFYGNEDEEALIVESTRKSSVTLAVKPKDMPNSFSCKCLMVSKLEW